MQKRFYSIGPSWCSAVVVVVDVVSKSTSKSFSLVLLLLLLLRPGPLSLLLLLFCCCRCSSIVPLLWGESCGRGRRPGGGVHTLPSKFMDRILIRNWRFCSPRDFSLDENFWTWLILDATKNSNSSFASLLGIFASKSSSSRQITFRSIGRWVRDRLRQLIGLFDKRFSSRRRHVSSRRNTWRGMQKRVFDAERIRWQTRSF